MSGALDSGMDIVIELSAQFFERIVRKQFSGIRVCITDLTGTRFEYPTGSGNFIPVRNVVPVIHGVRLGHNHSIVNLIVEIRVLSGEGQLRLDPDEPQLWTELDGTVVDFQIPLSTVTTEGNVELRLDLSALPADILEGLRLNQDESLHIMMPLDFLNQERDGTVLLSANVGDTVLLKAVNDDTLAIGIDVVMSRDPEWIARGGGLDVGGDEMDECALGIHGFPEQPPIDADHFEDEFSESIVSGSDWGIALDSHVVDALIRTINMDRDGVATEECEQEGARRSICLKLSELQDGVIRVSGHGEVYACPAEEIVPDDFYEVCFDADIRLSVDPQQGVRRPVFSGRYELIDVRFCCGDEGFNSWPWNKDANDYVTDEDRSGSLPFDGIATFFGDEDDITGELRMSHVEIRADGLIFRGIGSVQSPIEPKIASPESLLFATRCDEANSRVFRRNFSISNESGGRLHVCSLFLRDVPEDDPDSVFTHAGFFSVVNPDELREDGAGVTIEANESITVEMQIIADVGERYTALLDLPNNAAPATVKLIADLTPTEVRLESDELRLEHTDYSNCAGGFPRARSIRRSLQLTNQGTGNLKICSIEFPVNPRNADGNAAFLAGSGSYPMFLAAQEMAAISVVFNPSEADVGQSLHGTLRVHTNSGDFEVSLTGLLQHSYDVDPRFAGIAGSFADDRFCGDADWSMIQGSNGRLLDVQQVAEFLSFLGGLDCCPPPLGPVCLCVDLWEITLKEVPRGVRLDVRNESGDAVFTDRSSLPSRTLMVPIREGVGYTLHARLPKSVAGYRSPVIMRRWFAHQSGGYSAGQRLDDLAVAGRYAYAAGPMGLEVISLSDVEKPETVARLSVLTRASSIVANGQYLLAAEEGVLQVFSLTEPERPQLVGNLIPASPIYTLFSNQTVPALVWGAGSRLYSLDLSEPDHPKQIGKVRVRVRANRGAAQGGYAFLFGKDGMEVFDVSEPEKPRAASFLRLRTEVRNAFLVGSFALLIQDTDAVELVDISTPDRPRIAGSWKMEKWIREYVPLSGNVVQHKDHVLMLKRDQSGFRLMRLQRNLIDQEQLRGARSSSSVKPEFDRSL